MQSATALQGSFKIWEDTFTKRQQILSPLSESFPSSISSIFHGWIVFHVIGDAQIAFQEIPQYLCYCWLWHNTMLERNHIVSLLSLTTLEIKVRNFVFINTESIHKKWEKLLRNGTAELKVLLKFVHCVIMSKKQMVINFFTFAWPSEILVSDWSNSRTERSNIHMTAKLYISVYKLYISI